MPATASLPVLPKLPASQEGLRRRGLLDLETEQLPAALEAIAREVDPTDEAALVDASALLGWAAVRFADLPEVADLARQLDAPVRALLAGVRQAQSNERRAVNEQVLAVLRAADGPVQPSTIAEATGLLPTAVSRALRLLASEELAETVPVPPEVDQRMRLWRATAESRQGSAEDLASLLVKIAELQSFTVNQLATLAASGISRETAQEVLRRLEDQGLAIGVLEETEERYEAALTQLAANA